MKKSKRPRPAEPIASAKSAILWWPWAAGLGGLILAFWIYSPALRGPFVLDDRNLPFYIPGYERLSLLDWVKGTRPLLMLSFWLNFQSSGTDTYLYHVTNVFLHVLVSVVVALIAMRLLEWAGVKEKLLGVFAGALFLVHPVQAESVAYVASRSEVLSVLFFYGAYCVFVYRRTESITWTRAVAVLALFGAAVLTKQHTLVLPLLLVLTDLYWVQGGLRANRLLYGLLALGGIVGAVFVWRTLAGADTAGFHTAGFTPLTYFLTQCRVIWSYGRLFLLPIGLNADPEVRVSQSLLDPAAIVALAALLAMVTGAWFYRKRWPLAAFGVFVFLLLLAPTSSVVPIADAMQERRLYLPFLGLALVCLEFLRRLQLRQRLMFEVPVLLVLMAITYQRSGVWGDSIALWQDTVNKSPHKARPRFQLAYGYYEQKQWALAAGNYELTAQLEKPDYRLLVDWGITLDYAGRREEAIEKLRAATRLERDPQAWCLIGQVYGEQHKIPEAMAALEEAQKINPDFAMTYAIRGNVYETFCNFSAAAQQYQRALDLNPSYEGVREALVRVQRRASAGDHC